MRPATVLLLFTLATCSDQSASSSNGTGNRVPPEPPAHTGNRWSDYIAEQRWGERDAMLGKIIEASGTDCDLAKYHEYKGQYGHTAFWAVECDRTGDYLIGIAADSSTKVLPCKIPGLPDSDCWKPWDKGAPPQAARSLRG